MNYFLLRKIRVRIDSGEQGFDQYSSDEAWRAGNVAYQWATFIAYSSSDTSAGSG
jgi:hypothetical protein